MQPMEAAPPQPQSPAPVTQITPVQQAAPEVSVVPAQPGAPASMVLRIEVAIIDDRSRVSAVDAAVDMMKKALLSALIEFHTTDSRVS